MEAKLLHQVGTVSLHRREPQLEERRHFFVRPSFGEQLQDFFFAIREQVERIGETARLEPAHGRKFRVVECRLGAENRP